MKPFNLLFQSHFTEEAARAFLEEDHKHCDSCPEEPTCPIKDWNIETAVDNLFFFELFAADSYAEIQLELSTIIHDATIKSIVLIDPKEKCYIYKARGSIKQIEQELLPGFLDAFIEATGEMISFSTISDLREAFSTFHQNNLEAN